MASIFWAFVKKEFFHILRDRRTLFIMLGMPFALVLLFGYAVTTDFKHASVAVFDQSRDAWSQRLVARLQAGGYFSVVAHVDDIASVEQLFRQGRIKMAVVIPPHFGESLMQCEQLPLQLLTDGSEPNIATTLVSYFNDISIRFLNEVAQANGTALQPLISLEPRMVYNPAMKSVFMFVPGVIAVVLMLISAMLTSLSIAREKERGTLNLVLISPLPPLLIIVGKVLPYVVLSFLNALAIIGMGMGVFGMRMLGSWPFLLLSCLLFILTALSLGLFISTRVQTQQTAMFASLMGLMLPTVLLSGYIFPIESMPTILQVLSNVTPAKWFIILLKGIMLKGAGLEALWLPVVVLCGMALFFLLISWKNFKLHVE